MGPFQELGKNVDFLLPQVGKVFETIAQGLHRIEIVIPKDIDFGAVLFACSALLFADMMHDPPLTFVLVDQLFQRIRGTENRNRSKR